MLACDISKPALEVAQTNALNHQTDITFLQLDFLDPVQWKNLPHLDIIVSNPPYIPLKDKESMRANVVRYEPHLALFVDNNDPLIFYKAIAEFAMRQFKTEGSIYVEIHEELADKVRQVFEEKNFTNIELKKDLQGKYRMVRIKR